MKKRIKNELRGWALTALTVGAIVGGSYLVDKSKSNVGAYNLYSGKSNEYKVNIMETNDVLYTHVTGDSLTFPYAVTGHDFDKDGTWDNILIREKIENGYGMIDRENPFSKYSSEDIEKLERILDDANESILQDSCRTYKGFK